MKKISLIIFILFLGAELLAQSETEKLIQEGIVLHDQGKYKKAIKKYDEALEISPGDLLSLAEKAMTLQAMGEYEYCFEVCEEAIKTNPDSEYLDNIFTSYANALDLNRQHEKAIEVYERGIKKFPDYYNLYYNKGVTEAGINNLEESLKSFESAVKCNAFHGSSHQAIATIQLDKGAKIPALLSLCRFFVVEPQGSRASKNLIKLESIFNGSVTKNGKNSSTITIEAGLFENEDETENAENDFSETEMILSLSGLINLGFDELEMSEREKFLNNLNSIIGSLEETQEGKTGFYWDYYASYFIELKKKDFTEALSYMVYASREDKKAKKWISQNQDVFEKFYKWDNDYRWVLD